MSPELWETPEGWQRLKPLIDATLPKPVSERARFMDEVCGGDLELRRALEQVVNAYGNSTGPADDPLFNLHHWIPDNHPTFAKGELVLDRFRIVQMVGSGGMGEVYEALDLELGRVALKTIRPDIARNPSVIARFKREVQLALKISGPHLCRIHFLHVPKRNGEESRQTFLTMEFLDGVTLADKIRESGPLPWREVKTIALEICEGLRVMHEAGIIHRDMKSRNVMLAKRNGTVKAVVMDFGLADEVRSATSETGTDVSAEHGVTGTIEYMAPEQFAGEPLTPAADIFALGVVMYELVTGKHPFPSHTTLQAAVQRGRRPAPPSSIQKGLTHRCDEIVGKCLEFDPKKRYESVNEVAGALKSSPVSVSRLREEIAPIPKRRLLVLAVLSFLAIASVIGYIAYRSSRYHPPSAEGKRWYDRGLSALREGTYVQAVNALKMAIQHDEGFLLAHARLAEAWQELDFIGPAQTEMLSASVPDQESVLPDLDREYVEAVRATVTQDFPGAVDRYKAILPALPDDQKAYGYVDLGRAYEKTGDLKDALKSYEHAARLAPENPAPFVHLGILKNRQMDKDGGEAAFQKADSLYESESNLEGRAEVAYQRGYAANVRGDSEQAKSFLEKSLEMSHQIASPQLEARALTQITNVEYLSGNEDKAIEDANKAILVAQENGLEYWTTDAEIRLANAYLMKGDLVDAENSGQRALHAAEQNEHRRLKANAEFSLASIRDIRGKWDESIPLAEAALQYYKTFAFMAQAGAATDLIIRGEEGKGDTTQALKSATELLQLARTWDNPTLIEIAEESTGNILLGLERFPDALTHFEEALKASRSINEGVAYQELHCADTLWQLGRYNEADTMLKSISAQAAARSDIDSGIDATLAEMRLSQRHEGDALAISQAALKKFPDMPPDKVERFERVEALAESGLGHSRQAQGDAQQLMNLARKQADDESIADAELVQAAVDLQSHLPAQARSQALAANTYFTSKGEHESEWLSLFYIAEAAKTSGDRTACATNANKAVDILRGLEHSWSPPTYQQYTGRPDHQITLRELTKLSCG